MHNTKNLLNVGNELIRMLLILYINICKGKAVVLGLFYMCVDKCELASVKYKNVWSE